MTERERSKAGKSGQSDDTQRLTGLHSAGVHRQETTFLSPTTGAICTFLPGDMIGGDYQLMSLLGRGGMGIVFACKHLSLDRTYALKILSGQNVDEAAWARFQSEAKALARLNHAGIVRIHNMGIHKRDFPFYVMDLLEGETLDVKIAREGALSIDQTLDLFIASADALQSAHLNGIIHRDIKPSNMMLSRNPISRTEELKIVDFGIARVVQQQDFSAQSQTATGVVFGTPYYMSPEQCLGLRTDRRSDIYSLGCSLYEALTGSVPFQGENAFQTFLFHQNKIAPTLKSAAPRLDFPPDLEEAVSKMLAKNLIDRYQSMAQIKHDLERIQEGKPIMDKAIVANSSLAIHPANSSIKAGRGVEAKALSAGAKGAIVVSALLLAATVVIPVMVPSVRQATLEKLRQPMDSLFKGGSNLFAGGNQKEREAAAEKAAAAKAKASGDDMFGLPSTNSGRDMTIAQKEDRGLYAQSMGLLASPAPVLVSLGYTPTDLESRNIFSWSKLGHDEAIFEKRLADHIKLREITKAKFKTRTGDSFLFFNDISIGGISIEGKKPIRAIGLVKVPPGADLCIYLETASGNSPDLLNQFGPTDLTGLELIWKKPLEAIDRIKNWTRLKDLVLFNSAIKSPPGMEVLDECSIEDTFLPHLDAFPHLRTLGLAGYRLSVPAILKIPALKTLKVLKLKSIDHVDQLLQALVHFDNIEELWLVHEGTTADQLKPLTKMKNLSKLTVKLSILKPDSLSVCKQMKSLKELTLDRDWSEAEKNKFTAGLPHCRVVFERVTDHTFWNLLRAGEDKQFDKDPMVTR